MASKKRYIPPGARPKETTGGPRKNSEDSQRSLDDLVQDLGPVAIFTVELRSENRYGKCKVCRHVQISCRNSI